VIVKKLESEVFARSDGHCVCIVSRNDSEEI